MELSFWQWLCILILILICMQVIPVGIAGYYRNKAKGLAQGLHDALKIITKQEKEKHNGEEKKKSV